MKYTHESFYDMVKEQHPQLVENDFGGFAVGEGWLPMLAILLRRIDEHLSWKSKRGNPIDFQIAQVKEKFGSLRFYYDGGDEYIAGLVAMAESMSSRICEECGEPGFTRDGGWFVTLCDKHYAERKSHE